MVYNNYKGGRKHIVFGRIIGNSLGQIRSLGEVGLNPVLVWVGNDSSVLRNSKYLSEIHTFSTIQEGIDFLLSSFADTKIKHVLTIDSDGIVAEINKQYSELSKYFYFFNAGEDNRLTKMMGKESLCNLAKKHGLLVPVSEIVALGELPKKVTYPLLTKAVDSFTASWKTQCRICEDEGDLMNLYKTLDANIILLQNYIQKKNEFVLQGIAINAGKDVFIPIEGSYFRIPDGYFGSYLYFNGITKTGERLIKPVKSMLAEIGYEGVFEVEFIIDKEGNYIFLEINFRHTLWNHAFSNMGLNFCKIWSDAIINNKFPLTQSISIEKRHVLIHEFVDFLWYAKSRKVNIFKWILQFLGADSYVIWDRHDVKPFITYLKKIIKNKLRLC